MLYFNTIIAMTRTNKCTAICSQWLISRKSRRAHLLPSKQTGPSFALNSLYYAVSKGWHSKYSDQADVLRSIPKISRDMHRYGEKELGQFKWQWELRLANYPGQLSMKDIAEITGYNRETIRRWVSDGRIAYVEVGKKYIISKDELRSFLRCKFFGNITRKSAVHLRLVAYSCANAYKQEKGSEN